MSERHGKGSLFSEFPATSKKKWIDKINDDLKGADFQKKLVWKSLDGPIVDPFYTSEDVEHLDYLKNFHNLNLNSTNPQEGPRSWIIYENIHVKNEKKANIEAQKSLHMGGNGINYMLSNSNISEIASLLSSIYPNIVPVKFNLKGNTIDFLTQFLQTAEDILGIEREHIMGGFNFDPLMHYTLNGNLAEKEIQALGECLLITRDINDFRPVTVNGSHFHNSGANAAQEIAMVISAAVEYLERFKVRDILVKDFLSGFEFSMAVGTNFFMEIAKIRALRILFYNVTNMYEIQDFHPEDIKIHCESSVWTKTIYDPYVNMLRNTTEAMSAILGGCNSLSISAFDEIFNTPTDFSKRISRNISNLLYEESYFDKVSDPAAGSYYIEELTDKLVESSLEIFKELENNGGFVKSFEDGKIKSLIGTSRHKKHELISKRREVFIGTNQYPNTHESIDTKEIRINLDDQVDNSKVLQQTRGSIQFERLRLVTDNYAKQHGEEKRPRVFLSLIGNDKIMRKARSTFSSGFFGSAGFKVIESSPSPDLFKAVGKAIESKADIVVMCGSDEDYLSSGIDYATAFKANCKDILVVAGNPVDKIEELKEAGVDEFIHLRTNLIELLSSFQNQLKITNTYIKEK
jgi:methylmalonyl-CoA mutase